MAAQAPQLPTGVGNIIYSESDTVGNGISGYVFQYDSGWTFRYNAAGEFTGSTFSAPSGGGGGSVVPISTGVNPTETQYALYGHNIPLSVFGVGRIGGDIIAGPWIENGLATFCISFGVPADPTGTRTLREIAFDSEVIWTIADGFLSEAFTYRFYDGTLTQAADPLEISHFGADAVAYRPQILIWFENLPLAGTKFGKIPYVSAVISDSSGDDVNLGEAFERLAYSPWVGYTSDQFETVDITDGLVSGGLIIAQPAEFLATIQQFGRFYQNWDIIQTDKLRIVDRGSTVTPDVTLDTSTLAGSISLTRVEPNSVPRGLELSTIDPDADYTIVNSKASRPKDPVNVSASVATESQYLPMIMDSSTRMAVVTYAKYKEEVARKRISVKATMAGLEIEPGDLIGVSGLNASFPGNETFKVLETTHGANYTVEITAESLLNCTIETITSPPIITPPSFPALTGLIGWWDMSVTGSVTHGVDGLGNPTVTAMADQSGHGNDVSSTYVDAPAYSATGFNSTYPAFVFSGNSGGQAGLARTNFQLGSGNTLTIFAAAHMNSSAGGTGDFSQHGRLMAYTVPVGINNDINNNGSFSLHRSGFTQDMFLQRHAATTGLKTIGYATPRRIIATVRSDGVMTVYVDGVASTTGTLSANWVTGGVFEIGAGYNYSTVFHGFWGGAVAEAGIATGYHDATTVALLDTYLKNKWGM